MDYRRLHLQETTSWEKSHLGEAVSLEIRSRLRTHHSKGVYVSLLLEVVQPHAAGAFKKDPGEHQDSCTETGSVVTENK